MIDEGVRFLVNSVRPDGSWPIDTNLATWVTTLSVNALAAAGDLESLDTKDQVLAWLLGQQYKTRHPYTGADPGGWAWTDLPGGVPDCDDTPGAMLAVHHLTEEIRTELIAAKNWLYGLRNADWGFPTFCRGWGKLPFDRSGCDLTAHSIRALDVVLPPVKPFPKEVCMMIECGRRFLEKQQRTDGSWLPLWFGNQHAKDDVNPVYGTSRVLAAYRDVGQGLGIAVTLDGGGGPRPAGELQWSGLFSTFYSVAPSERLILIFMTQLLPLAESDLPNDIYRIVMG